MPRTASANKRIRDETVEKILEAAERVFSRKGMAAKMSDVALAAGVSQGLAYHYFPSKESIFAALVRKLDQPEDEARTAILKIPGTPVGRLAQIVSAMIERRRRFPQSYQFLSRAMEEDSLPKDLRERLHRLSRLMRETIRELVIEGQATGEISRDDPDKLTRALLACIDGLSRMTEPALTNEVGRDVPEAGIILRMLRPDSDRAR